MPEPAGFEDWLARSSTVVADGWRQFLEVGPDTEARRALFRQAITGDAAAFALAYEQLHGAAPQAPVVEVAPVRLSAPPPDPLPDDRLLLDVADVAALLSISPVEVNRLVTAGRLQAIRIGRRVRVPRTAVDQLVNDLVEEASAPCRIRA